MGYVGDAVRRARVLAYKAYLVGWLSVTSRSPIGTNVYERDWDALVLLDTCRVDALRAVEDEYEYLDGVEALTSVGSTSTEWIANTFRRDYDDEIAGTAYISANAFAKRVIEQRDLPGDRTLASWDVVDPSEFLLLDNAWEYQPRTRFKHMLPEPLTDRAITVGREASPERLIVHYSQPHAPYVANARSEDRELENYEASPFEALRTGETPRQKVWDAYLDNLRMVLDCVGLLLDNLDAETVAISADHGEAFGEYGVYGHPTGHLLPQVKRVPWVETTATDTGAYEPSFESESVSRTVEGQLADLGYLE